MVFYIFIGLTVCLINSENNYNMYKLARTFRIKKEKEKKKMDGWFNDTAHFSPSKSKTLSTGLARIIGARVASRLFILALKYICP